MLRTFTNRFEKKYVIDIATYKALVKDLQPFVERDKHAGPRGKYNVLSLYYDSDTYRSFTEKIDGEKKRAKLRLRRYQAFGDKPQFNPKDKIFLEIKKKNNLTVFKERSTLSFAAAEKFIENPVFTRQLLKGLSKKEIDALTETAMMKSMYHLKPKILIHYIREPFVSKFNLNLRITFDSCLKYRKNDLRLVTKPTDKLFLPLNLMVLELKYNVRLPIWIIDIFQKHKCSLNTYSKYCNGLIHDFENNHGIIY